MEEQTDLPRRKLCHDGLDAFAGVGLVGLGNLSRPQFLPFYFDLLH